MRSALESEPRPPETSDASLWLLRCSVVGFAPAAAELLRHAHGADDFGIAAAGFYQGVARGLMRGGSLDWPAREDLGTKRNDGEDNTANNGADANQPMEHEADGEIERRPRKIGQCRRSAARKEGADMIEIAQGLRAVATAAHPQRQTDDNVVNAWSEQLVEIGTDTDEHSASDRLKQGLEGIKGGHKHGESRPAWARCGWAARGHRPAA